MKDSYQIALKLYQEAINAGRPRNICQCCGAAVEEGLKGCFELFAELCARGYTDPQYGAATFYGMDAHALQHPEIHGKKNNTGHLLRLCWIFERGAQAQSGTVPKWWQTYIGRNDIISLEPPLDRGKMTVVEVAAAKTPEEYEALMQQWALSVYKAWHGHHDWAKSELARIFKE
jgi:hypothetical protein